MPLLGLVVLLWFTPIAAFGQQCCGDCSGDGEVSISDLITAVNNSLNGCAATSPTPTPPVGTPTATPAGQCPIDFQDDNSGFGTPDCYYRGRWNQTCGADDLETLWRSDGDILIITLLGFDQVPGEGLFFGAEVNGAGNAQLFCWYMKDDASDCEQHSITGDVALSAGGGTLTIVPQPSPFTIEDCDFVRYSGALFAVDTPSSARAASRVGRVHPETLQRLRAAATALPVHMNFRRR
ncbi:MAG: hypothetical protein ABI629_15630 [bacterium]